MQQAALWQIFREMLKDFLMKVLECKLENRTPETKVK